MERQLWELAIEVHGSPEAAQAAEDVLECRQRALAARLGCRWCGGQADRYFPRDPTRTYPLGHLRGGLAMPFDFNGRSRFVVTIGQTVGECADCADADDDGDLDARIARAVLVRAGADGDECTDAWLALFIREGVPCYWGTAVEPWSHVTIKVAAEVVATARERRSRVGNCPSCRTWGELHPTNLRGSAPRLLCIGCTKVAAWR
jgi:hypothetical protein